MEEVTPFVELPSTTPTALLRIGLITSALANTIPCNNVDLSTFACATYIENLRGLGHRIGTRFLWNGCPFRRRQTG